jgi:HK97 family phage major capsid protein
VVHQSGRIPATAFDGDRANAVFQPPNGLAGAPLGTLLGKPINIIEQCETVGTVGDIMLANLGEYVMIDKGGLKSDVSMHVRFLNDEQTFRWTYRVDGQPAWNSALTPYKGSNTLSPFVTLAAR